jgi:AraC-like DNA-binding protein
MGVPVARSEAHTFELDEGIHVTREAFGDGVEIAPPDSGGTEVSIRYFSSPELMSIRWRQTGIGHGSRDGRTEERPVLLTGVVVGGGLRLRTSDEQDVDTSRPFLYPSFVASEVAAPNLANLALTEDVVVKRARAMTHDDRFQPRFLDTAPITPTLDRIWRNTMAYADRTLAELVDEPDGDLAATGLVDLVVTQLLHVFPNTALEVEDERSTGQGTTNAGVRRALAFIDEHLTRPFSVVDVAEASGLSLRGLHAAFLRELETTPMRFVRSTRLAAAREELHRAPEAVDLGVLARRWGFSSEASFATVYRSTFAETPAETLRMLGLR